MPSVLSPNSKACRAPCDVGDFLRSGSIQGWKEVARPYISPKIERARLTATEDDRMREAFCSIRRSSALPHQFLQGLDPPCLSQNPRHGPLEKDILPGPITGENTITSPPSLTSKSYQARFSLSATWKHGYEQDILNMASRPNMWPPLSARACPGCRLRLTTGARVFSSREVRQNPKAWQS